MPILIVNLIALNIIIPGEDLAGGSKKRGDKQKQPAASGKGGKEKKQKKGKEAKGQPAAASRAPAPESGKDHKHKTR